MVFYIMYYKLICILNYKYLYIVWDVIYNSLISESSCLGNGRQSLHLSKGEGMNLPRKFSADIESRVMGLISAKPMSVSKLAKELGLRREFVSGYLEALREQGKLEMVTVGRSYVYVQKSK